MNVYWQQYRDLVTF